MERIGYLLAVTPNDEVNALAALHFEEVFPRSNTFQLPPEEEASVKGVPQHLQARWLFDTRADYWELARRVRDGAVFKKTSLTPEFGYGRYREHYGDAVLPMFAVSPSGVLSVLEARGSKSPKAGQTLISLVSPTGESQRAAEVE